MSQISKENYGTSRWIYCEDRPAAPTTMCMYQYAALVLKGCKCMYSCRPYTLLVLKQWIAIINYIALHGSLSPLSFFFSEWHRIDGKTFASVKRLPLHTQITHYPFCKYTAFHLAQLVEWLLPWLGGTGFESRLGWPFMSYHLILVCVNYDLENGTLPINSRLHASLNNQLSIHLSILTL